MLGREPDTDRAVNQNDTVELIEDWASSDPNATADDVIGVQFVVETPSGVQTTIEGEVGDDGAGFARWTNTSEIGHYKVLSRFFFDSGEVRSIASQFEILDPFEAGPSTDTQTIADQVWMRIEDCFDSDEGGPWLRDRTLSFFNKNKVAQFIPEGLLEINLLPPMTNVTIPLFTVPVAGGPNPDEPLLVQATLVSVIRHLMRSYTEQPLPTGASALYEDRRDYLQRWGTILLQEEARMKEWIALWKRQFLQLGHSKVLVGNKAGRIFAAPMRTRYVGRGYY